MSEININTLFNSMKDAAAKALAQKGADAKDYTGSEFMKIAEAIAFIEKERLANNMTDEQAGIHLNLQKNTTKTVLLTLTGLGSLAVEQVINDALKSVASTVNTAVGFKLIA